MNHRKEKLDLIRKCCKDDESFLTVKSVIEELEADVEKYKTYLDLLERSVRNDYDSILITELELEKPGPRIVYVNDGFSRITGYTREEVVGKTPRILQGEKTDRAVLDKLKQRLKDGQSFFGHTVNYRKDGSEFINQWDIHPLTDDEGRTTHWVSYQHDVTERKRSERALVDTEIEFDKLHEEVKAIKADIDPQGRFVSSSKSFRELVGHDAAELNELTLWELAGGRDLDALRELLASTGGEISSPPRSFVLEMKPEAGKAVEVNVTPKRLTSDGETVVRLRMSNRSLEKKVVNLLRTRSANDRILNKKVDFTYGVKPEGEDYIYHWVSESFSTITGVPESEIKGTPVRSMVSREEWPRIKNHLDKVMQGHSSTVTYRISTRGGTSIPVIDSANPKIDADNRVKSVRGSVLIEISSERKAD